MATPVMLSTLQTNAAESRTVQWRDRQSLAVYRLMRDLCWPVLTSGGEIGPRRILESAGLRPVASEKDLKTIPASGPVLALADCPPGVIESLAAAALLRQVRPDAKVLASHFIARAPKLAPAFIGYDPWPVRPASRPNVRALFASLAHLRSGGLLAVFPSDGSLRGPADSSREPGWAAAARMARLSGAAIVPISCVHPQAPASAFADVEAGEIEMRVGAPLDPQRLAGFSSDDEAGSYLRWRTTLLARRREPPVRLVPRLFPLPKAAGL